MGLEVVGIEQKPSYAFTCLAGGKWRANIVYVTQLAGLDFTPSEECIEIRFFTPEEARQENLCENVDKLIDLMEQN